MKLSVHGADRGVTGSCHLIESGGYSILIDCGLDQGGRELEEEHAVAEIAIFAMTEQDYDNGACPQCQPSIKGSLRGVAGVAPLGWPTMMGAMAE